MAGFHLQFQVPATIDRAAAEATFYWPAEGAGSFRTRLGPKLGQLGSVQQGNIDLFSIAAVVYAADRTVPRSVGRVNWTSRSMALTIPVNDPEPWNDVSSDLTALLDFLSGDTWELNFRRVRFPQESVERNPYPNAERIVLMSGGADSTVGAFLARSEPLQHVLASHIGATFISPIQRDIAERIRDLLPHGSTQHHQQVTFTRKKSQPNGYEFRNEYSTRTRSFLFLALGLAIASVNSVPLWIPENGFASLNPPLGPDQLGSLSTRTTHPWFLNELSRVAVKAGAFADITNPFADRTKGEMFRWLANKIGDDAAATLLSATNSCAYTNGRYLGIKAKQHCGTCFGCLIRRASFAAARLEDKSYYVSDAPPTPEIGAQLERASILPSIRGFVARGVRVGDIAAMRLPEGYTPSQARDLCVRGAGELEQLI